jgi:hypothetical protein
MHYYFCINCYGPVAINAKTTVHCSPDFSMVLILRLRCANSFLGGRVISGSFLFSANKSTGYLNKGSRSALQHKLSRSLSKGMCHELGLKCLIKKGLSRVLLIKNLSWGFSYVYDSVLMSYCICQFRHSKGKKILEKSLWNTLQKNLKSIRRLQELQNMQLNYFNRFSKTGKAYCSTIFNTQ